MRCAVEVLPRELPCANDNLFFSHPFFQPP
jgi:hypothetical protein